jgi:glycosyltransferase involved in cell wall biosynthesis
MINVFYEVRKKEDIHLVLMGVGHHSDQLEIVKKQITDLKLNNNVTLLNWTSRLDVLNIISKSRIYISTARYEGLPYSIIESLLLGIPCVVSNCDGNRDLIRDNYNGYIIDHDNAVDFSSKIIKILNDNILHVKFSRNAKLTFGKHYNIKETIKELELIYKESLN